MNKFNNNNLLRLLLLIIVVVDLSFAQQSPPDPGQRNFNNNDGSPSTDNVTPLPSNDQYKRPDLEPPSTDVVTPSPSNDQYRRPDLEPPSTDVVTPSPSNDQYRRPDLDTPKTDKVLPNQGTSPLDSMQGDDPSSYSNSNYQPPEPGQRNFGNNNYGSPRTDIVTPNQYRRPDLDSPRTDRVLPNQGTSFLDNMQGDDPSAYSNSNYQPPEPGQRNFGNNNYGSPRTDIVVPSNDQYRRPDVNSNDQYRRPDVNSNDQYRRPDVNSNNQYRRPDLDSPRTDRVLPNQGTSFLDTMQGDDPSAYSNSNYQPPEPGQRNFGNNNYGSPRTDIVVPSNDQYRRPTSNSPRTDIVVPSNNQYRRPDLDSPRTDRVLPNQGTSFLDNMQGDDPSVYSSSNFQPPEPGRRNFENNNYGSPRTDIVVPSNDQYRRPDVNSNDQYRRPDVNSNDQYRRPDVNSNDQYRRPDVNSNDQYRRPDVNSNDQYRRPDVNSNDQYRRPTSNSPRTDIVVPFNDQYRRPDLNSNDQYRRSDYNSNDQYRRPTSNSPRTDIVVPFDEQNRRSDYNSNDQYRRPDLNSNDQYRRHDVNSNDQYSRPNSNSPRTDIVVPSNDPYRRPELGSTTVVVPSVPNGGNNNGRYSQPPEPGQSELRPYRTTRGIDLNSPRTDIVLPPNNQYRRPDVNPNDQYRRPTSNSPRTDIVIPTSSSATTQSINNNGEKRNIFEDEQMQGDDPNPIEPGHRDFNQRSSTTVFVPSYRPPEPGRPDFHRPTTNVYVPPAPNNNDGGVYVPPAPNNNDGGVYVPPAPNNNNNNQRYPPSTDPILPPNYGSNRRPYNSPSTDRILPTSPSTTPIQIIASYPGGGNSPSTSSIVVPPLNNAPEPGRREFFDRNRPYWQCNMANNNNDQCRLENRANFVQFKRGLYQNTHALLLDITEAIRLKESLPRLNPVRSYNAGRLVTKDYFPANNNRIACLHFSFVWDGPEDKRMHLIQRNSDDKCIYSTHSHGLNDQHNGRWQDLELQLDLSQGDLAFLIEFSFDINRSSMIDNQTRRPYPIQTSNTTNAFGRYDSIIAVRDFTIGYGYCKNNQAIECDLPI
ncbi:hypothetical protein DERP_011232 [Dermatophagoides pteronyssinus]|uniref:GATA zinc finger domain-containing protein 14-like n=1 Tax=Dermatophagoides pteronyssinus TaxID=6956 RepID=A0ABQ8JCY9_DERPT|nr:hypothetical protein DERP_011232 [Dermatophagoides pteronyssinus]